MANQLLFVFEGERTEKIISDNLSKYFVNEDTIVQCAYCNNIYELHKKIAADEDLDTFLLLKEIPSNKEILARYRRADFAEIYLFFDYDGHDTSADDEKVKEALNFFNEETASGRLFISYPMVEALKHYSDNFDFKDLKVKAKENIGYKTIVGKEAHKDLIQVNKYTQEIWVKLIEVHLMKMNYIVNDDYTIPTFHIPQLEILNKQLEKYLNVDSTVGVLSSFPVFIFDYYGVDNTSKLLQKTL